MGQWSDKGGVGQFISDLEEVARSWYPRNLGVAMLQVDKNYEDFYVLCGYSLEEKISNLSPATLLSLQPSPSPLTGGHEPSVHGHR